MKIFPSFFGKELVTAAYCCGLVLAGASFSSAHAQTYSGPLTISDANCGTVSSPSCTFTGNWESTDPGTSTITITTARAVTIQNSRIRGGRNLIYAKTGTTSGVNVTVRNTRGYGLNLATDTGLGNRFLIGEGFTNITVENCYLEGTAGIYLHNYKGNGTSSQTARIRYNVVRNIDGRISDGAGGYKTGNTRDVDYRKVQFVQFGTTGLPGAEISWNEVINYPGQSRVEDNINMYDGTSGKSSTDPIKIHDNYIQGAYPIDPANMSFTGGGILLSDGSSSNVTAYNNQVVNTAGYGISIQGGQNNNFHDNRIVSTGYLPDGTYIKGVENATGAVIWDYRGDGTMANDTSYNNAIGYYRSDGAHNTWFPNDSPASYGNTSISPVTLATEQAEWATWKAKSGSQSIGPTTVESNLINNASFDADGADTQTPTNWNEWGGPNGTDANASKVEAYDGHGGAGAHSGARHATHYRSTAYEVKTSSYTVGLTKGLYTAKVWVRNGGGQTICRLNVSDYGGGPDIFVDAPVTNTWTQLTVSDIPVTGTHCQVQLYSKAGAAQWAYFDDAELRKQ